MDDGYSYQPPPPPPPPLPQAPEGYRAQPVIRWGLGDVFWGLLLYLVGGVAAALVLVATGQVDSSGEIENLNPVLVALLLMGGWLGFVGWPVVATYTKGQRSLAKDFGLEIRWIDVGWGVLAGAIAIGLSVLANLVWRLLSGDDAPSNAGFLPEDPTVLGALVLFVFVAVLTPIAEELFFRGLLLRAAGRRWGLPIGVAVSSVVFGCLHFEGSAWHGLFFVVVTAVYGAVFAWVVVRAGGRLGPSIVAHACVNGLGVIALLVG
ncbi:MAG TPA: CPBP family intramembrane glutamic endopeptidase [Acidimicrobiales bacterium]